MFNQNREDMAPYRAAGYGALDAQSSLLGMGTDPAALTEAAPWVQQHENLEPGDYERLIEIERKNRPGAYQRYLEEKSANITNRLRELPGYQFRMNEGVQARDRSAAARGMTLSGAQQKALTEYGQGLADQTYGQQLNRLASLAGTGQTATTNVAQMGTNMAQAQGQNMMGAAQARGSSYLTGANQAGNAMNSLAYIWS
jgi:hypothetical protein